ncbi:glycosyltransferase family 2 protein [Inquilinus sp.]|uniref:glycosyltransferase family 2 protein n=1 Tax=Inquilinus sp. TaxID=1932117 RepID=UPI003783CC50
MDGQNTFVSIVTVDRNRGDLVTASTESLLSQTHREIEITAVDDGSGDETCDHLRAFDAKRLTVISPPNEGFEIARQQQVDADPERQQRAAGAANQRHADHEVEQDRAGQQRQVPDRPPAVEGDGRDQQDRNVQAGQSDPPQHEEGHAGEGQEDEQELG